MLKVLLMLVVGTAAMVKIEEEHTLTVLIRKSFSQGPVQPQIFGDLFSTMLASVKGGYEATALAIAASKMHVMPAIIASQKLISETMNSVGAAIIHLIKQDAELAVAIKLAEDVWPGGSYCILAAGKCPAGFCRKEGHIHAIQQIAHENFLKAVSFGDSSVKHRDFLQLADINIVTCCKGDQDCGGKTNGEVEEKTEE